MAKARTRTHESEIDYYILHVLALILSYVQILSSISIPLTKVESLFDISDWSMFIWVMNMFISVNLCKHYSTCLHKLSLCNSLRILLL